MTKKVIASGKWVELVEDNGWEYTLIGRRVRVYWPFEDRKYEASITKYHLRKNKYRIDYDDGEHEWIDLRTEQDRVQIRKVFDDGDVQWIDFRLVRDPAKSKGFGVRSKTNASSGGGLDRACRARRSGRVCRSGGPQRSSSCGRCLPRIAELDRRAQLRWGLTSRAAPRVRQKGLG